MDLSALKRKKDILIGLGMIFLGICYFIGGLYIKEVSTVQVSGSFMPNIYATIAIIVGFAHLISSLRKNRVTNKVDEEKQDKVQKEKEQRVGTKNALLAFLVIVVYAIVIRPIGFIISSILFLFFMCGIITPAYKKRNYIGYLIFSIILTFVAYYFFRHVMYLALPRGIFGF